jgi:SAM-dependent methyltransferase
VAVGDNLDEYRDAARYDAENPSFEPDGPFYLELARRIGGPALELGCGTGRVTIPLARTGIETTGLDASPSMVERARAKDGAAVRWVRGDARTFRLDGKFRFIFEAGGTFQHMLDRADQEAFLARVLEHLDDDGRLVVGALVPTVDLMADVPIEEDWFTRTDPDGRLVRVSGTQHYDALTQIKTETAYRRWSDAEGREVTDAAPLRLRYVFPQEMLSLLHYNGFEVLQRYGDTDFGDLTAASPSMYFVCGRRAS